LDITIENKKHKKQAIRDQYTISKEAVTTASFFDE
jgi:hypothetical protein